MEFQLLLQLAWVHDLLQQVLVLLKLDMGLVFQ